MFYNSTPIEKELKEALWQKLMDAKIWLYRIQIKEVPGQNTEIAIAAEQDIGVYLDEGTHYPIIERIVRPEFDKHFDKYTLNIRSTGHPL